MKFLNKMKEKLQNFRQQAMERTKEEKLAIRRKAREKAKKWRRLIGAKHMVFGALVFGMVTGMLSYSGVLEEADHWISDSIFHMDFCIGCFFIPRTIFCDGEENEQGCYGQKYDK